MPAEAPLLDSDLEIREALPDDAHAIAALYVWHVLNGRASFEEIQMCIRDRPYSSSNSLCFTRAESTPIKTLNLPGSATYFIC